MSKYKLFRITTVPRSLALLKGQLKFMSKHFDVIAITNPQPEEYLQKVSEEEEVPVIGVEMTRRITLIKDIKAVFSLFKIFKKEKPLIVHTHTPKAGTVGMIAAFLARVPNRLHTVAGLPLLEAVGRKRTLLDFVEKITYACATKVYSNSLGLKNIILKNRYCPSDKIKVIANGSSNGINANHFSKSHFIDKELDQLRKSLNIEKDDFVFIFVGRLVKDKGINELIEAFKKISNTHKNVSLLLVGRFERELDPLFSETVTEIKNNPNIIETGFQTDVRPYFAISNVLVFPSYREGFPNVVMQAGAMELPSIVTDINGCNEIVENEKNGLIVPPKDTDALKNAMGLLLDNIGLRENLKSNSREMITSRYEQQIVWEALLKEYRELEINYK